MRYENWIPPFNSAAVKELIEADLREALAEYIGKDVDSENTVRQITTTIQAVTTGWENRLSMLVDMSVTSEELIADLNFGETDVEVHFEFPTDWEA